jgi:large subunit ribosomal protein L21
MFAVVRTGGKQYRVHPGDTIVVEKLAGDAGDKVTLGDVLLAGDGGKLEPTNGLTVAAEIVAQGKGDKVTVFKKRRRHNYRRKKGHRQQHTILRIVAVGDHKAEKPAKPAKADAAPKPGPAGDPAKTDAAETKAVKTKAAAIKPATVSAEPTENPAPANEAQANPPAQSVDAPSKTAKTKAKDKPTAKTPSTKNAALAKGGAKKTPKAK